jgi:uncharacterized protein YggE
MARLSTVSILAIGIVLAAASRPAVGQTLLASQSVVSGAGVAVVKRQPELMRMRVELTATGKDLKEALANLKAHREAATKVCSDQGAVADSIAVGSPHIVADISQRQRMMSSFPTPRNSGRGKKPEVVPPVNVSAWLTAEWPLKGSDAEELLLVSQSLRDKLKSDLGKSMPKAELSPEQEEIQEEAVQEMSGNPNGAKPGEPTFVFVAKVSDADYAKAAAKAFAMAKAHAERLANAAGASLGELRSVEGNDRQAMAMMNYPRQYENGVLQEDDSPEPDVSSDEATGANPVEVRLTIAIGASFAIGK